MHIRNNIYGNGQTGYNLSEWDINWISQWLSAPGASDYSCWYNFTGPDVIWSLYGTRENLTLAQFQARTGAEAHSFRGQDPLFVNASGGDFHLQAGSPCRGTGEGGVDIGAFPYGTVLQTPPSVTITVPTSAATYTTSAAAIALGGTASDSDGTVAAVSWANNRGGSGTAAGTATWSVPSIALQTGANVITIAATDNDSLTGSDVLTVTYTLSTTNNAPVAVASPSPGAIVGPATLVTLNGSASYDPDAGDTIAYAWTYVSGPGNPGLSGASQPAATFSTTVQGTYTFRLTVTDDGSLSDTADVVVTVTAPWADAGPDRVLRLTLPAHGEGLESRIG
jgi:hypothetical protein